MRPCEDCLSASALGSIWCRWLVALEKSSPLSGAKKAKEAKEGYRGESLRTVNVLLCPEASHNFTRRQRRRIQDCERSAKEGSRRTTPSTTSSRPATQHDGLDCHSTTASASPCRLDCRQHDQRVTATASATSKTPARTTRSQQRSASLPITGWPVSSPMRPRVLRRSLVRKKRKKRKKGIAAIRGAR